MSRPFRYLIDAGCAGILAAAASISGAQSVPSEGNGSELDPHGVVPDDRERILQLQLFLDKTGFRPGTLDGLWGEFTKLALQRYREAHGGGGKDYGDEPPHDIGVDASAISVLTTTYTISEKDAKFVGSVPEEPAAMAKKESLPYESLAELVAERFHCDPNFFASLNPDIDTNSLKPGDKVHVPAVHEPFEIKAVADRGSDSADDKPEASDSKLVVHVDTVQNMLTLRDGDRIVAAYPTTPGSESNPAPKGELEVQSITFMPTFRYDEEMLERGVRSDDYHMLPAGPNSPVGIVWIALDRDGIGIHGTRAPDTIGRAASHGCIRLSNWDAEHLAGRIADGTRVVVEGG